MARKYSVEDVKEKMADRNATKVAKAIGITQAAMSGFLAGRFNLSLANFEKLVDYLYPEEEK